jgi:hypothetical protein
MYYFNTSLRVCEHPAEWRPAQGKPKLGKGLSKPVGRHAERILLAIKQAHPEIQYIEAWNEPDAPGTTIQPAEVYQWVARRQGLKDEFVTQNSVGPYLGGDPRNPTILWQPYDPLPGDALTPYGNVLFMQSKMEDVKVSATTDQLNNGVGVYAVAAKDPVLPEASVMVWNYPGCSGLPGSTSCGSSAYHATIELSRLPNGLADGDVTVTVYRVDQNTSNYFSDPTNTDVSKGNLQQVDQRTVTPVNGSYTYEADLQPNAVYLLLLRKDSGQSDGRV